jgi:hypothetical protein
MADALIARGTDEVSARLAAEVGALAFGTAYTRWAAPGNERSFTEIAHAALRDLQARASTLGAGAAESPAAESPRDIRALPGSGFTMEP